jgi:hypothetical protein
MTPGGNVQHCSRTHRDLFIVERHLPLAIEDVVEFGADFVIVGFGAVDIHRVSPGGDVFVALAEKPIRYPQALFSTVDSSCWQTTRLLGLAFMIWKWSLEVGKRRR